VKIIYKLIIIVVLATLLASGAGTFLFFYVGQKSVLERFGEQLKSVAILKENQIHYFVHEQRFKVEETGADLMAMLATENEATKTDRKISDKAPDFHDVRFLNFLKRNLSFCRHFREFFILDLSGLAVVSTDNLQENKNFSDKDYYLNGLKAVYVSNFYYVQDTKKTGLTISMPLTNNENVTIGVLVGVIDLQGISEIMSERAGLGISGETFLVNNYHFPITALKFTTKEAMPVPISTDPVNYCLNGNSGQIYAKDYRGVNVIAVYNWLEDFDACLIAKYDRNEALALFYDLTEKIIFFSILIIFLVILLGYLLLKTIVDPIKKLRDGVQIIKNGDLDHRVGTESNDEIGHLSRDFDKMTSAIKESRVEINRKVEDQTKEIIRKNNDIEKQRLAILNVLEDVSQERDQSTKERDKIDTILKSLGDGVLVVDNEQKVEFLNPAAEELTGWSLAAAQGTFAEKVFNIYDEASMKKRESPIAAALKTGKISILSNHTVLKTKDGQIIPIADSAAPVKDSENNINGAVLVFRDMIQERINEEKIIHAKASLEELNKELDLKVEQKTKELRKAFDELKGLDAMKDEFLNISAHELKTPLTSIIGLSQLIMLKKQGGVNIKQKKSLSIIFNEANRLLGIIKKILGITRIEAKKAIFNMQKMDVCQLVPKVIESLQSLAKNNDVSIVHKCSSSRALVSADPDRIQEVIYNLIDNALKFSPPKSKIFVSSEIEKGLFIFSVKDQGPGIDPNKKDKLFQKFSQLDTGFARKQEGTGLGLYICKIILENMKGKIWVESVPGQGATFKFSLPLAKK